MRLFSKSCYAILALIFFSATAFAQGSMQPPPPAPPPGPPGFPIDSSILILLIFAVGLGLYKINQFKHKKTPN